MNGRRIPLKGACNFRDIGGYPANNGLNVKHGMIYRSGHLANLNKFDLKQLEQLKIKLIIDLRSQDERDYKPTRLPANNTTRTAHLSFHDGTTDIKLLYRKIFSGKLGDIDCYQYILAEYKRYITQHVKEITTIFKLLQDSDNYPLLIHCNGGKDRTGTVIALILFALGVKKEHVFIDYMLSEQYMKNYITTSLVKIKILSLFRANITQLKPIMETRPEYLQSALYAIETQHGSVYSYLNHLGVNQNSRALLAKFLCE